MVTLVQFIVYNKKNVLHVNEIKKYDILISKFKGGWYSSGNKKLSEILFRLISFRALFYLRDLA